MKNFLKTKNFIWLAVFSIILVLPNFVSAATAEELQAQIQALMAQIQQLQAQLAQTQSQPAQWCHNFNINLGVGNSGDDVCTLRTALQKEGFETEDTACKFDEELASAISGFQQKYVDEILRPSGLRYGTGYVGKATRAKLNKLYGCGITSLPTTPVQACNAFLTCETGYKPYNTNEKDSQGCPIIKCIPPATPVIPPISTVSEQVKCLFHESTTAQECYSSAGVGCKDTSACVVDVKGAKGEQITWKSTCGGYAYTTMDGQNEYAEFKCATSVIPTPTPTPTTSTQIQTPIPTTPKLVTSPSTIGTGIRRFKPIDPSRCVGIIETSCTIEPANIIKVSVYDEKGGFIDTRENNNSGMAGFLNLPYGNYTVVINAEGFEYYKASFTVCATCEETTTIYLKKISTSSTIPSITLLSPNGGESWAAGSTQTIHWSSQNVSRISLDLVNSSGALVVKNLVNLTGNPGSATWIIPTYIEPGQYWMRVGTCDSSVVSCTTTGAEDLVTIYDKSDAAFSIVAPGTTSQSDTISQMANVLESARTILNQMIESLKNQ